ncbi:MAG: hypothetical protein IT445_20910 [Phycisphaeraceae bacterium]|nr:hypothetical protein [Phycisphaeraceae bacterium]
MQSFVLWAHRFAVVLATCAALLLCASPLHAELYEANWLAPVDGNWTDASKWDINQVPSNGQPNSASTYDVTIAANGTSSYAIRCELDATINSLLINDPLATLNITNQLLQVEHGIDIQAGTLQLSYKGSLANTTISGAGRFRMFLTHYEASLTNVTLATDMLVEPGCHLTVNENLILNDAVVRFVTGSESGASFIQFEDGGSVTGTGGFYTETLSATLDAYSGTIFGSDINFRTGAGTLTIRGDGGTTINGTALAESNDLWFYGYSPGGIINQGTIQAINGCDLYIEGVDNRNQIYVGPNSQLTLSDTNWINNGTITAEDTVISIIGNFGMSQLGNLVLTNTDVHLACAVIDDGSPLHLNAATGSWTLRGYGSLEANVRLETSGGTSLKVEQGQFNQADIAGVVNVIGPVSSTQNLSITSQTLLNSTSLININTGIVSIAPDGLASDSTGHIVFNGSSVSNAVLRPPSGSILVIPSGVTIRNGYGDGTITYRKGGTSQYDARFINQGLISAQGQGNVIEAGADAYFPDDADFLINHGTMQAMDGGTLVLNHCWNNDGLIRVDGGTLHLAGNFTLDELGSVDFVSGDVQITGTFDLGGSTLQYGPGHLPFHLGGPSNSSSYMSIGYITNGRLEMLSPAALTLEGNTAALSDVQLAGTLVVPTLTKLEANNIDLDNAVIDMQGDEADNYYNEDGPIIRTRLDITKTSDWTGNGTVIFNGFGLGNKINIDDYVIGLGSGIVIENGSGDGRIQIREADVSNAGLIHAHGTNRLIEIVPTSSTIGGITTYSYPSLSNSGILKVSDGATLSIGKMAFSNTGQIIIDGGTLNLGADLSLADMAGITRTGGTFNFSGNLDLTGGTFNLDASLGPWNVNGGSFRNGALQLSDNAMLQLLADGSVTFDNVALPSNLDLTLNSGQTLSLLGNWSNAGHIVQDGGLIQLGGQFASIQLGNYQYFAGDMEIIGTWNPQGAAADLDAPNMPQLVLNGGQIRETTLSASQGSHLIVRGASSMSDMTCQAGLVFDQPDAQLDLSGVTLQGNNVASSGAAVINILPGVETVFDGATMAANVFVDQECTLRIQNGLVLNSDLRIGISSSFPPLPSPPKATVVIDGSQTIGGSGRVQLLGSAFSPSRTVSYLTLTDGSTLTIGPDASIIGGGSLSSCGGIIQGNNASLVNHGLIAVEPHCRIYVYPQITNYGDIRLNDGSLTSLSDQLINAASGTISGTRYLSLPVGELINHGTISPGLVTGTLTISGAVTQGATGRIEIDLADEAQDLLSTSSIALDGTLAISLADGFTPQLGRTFSIITGTTLSGHFAFIDGVVIDNNLSLAVTYSGTAVTVTAALPGDATLDGIINLSDLQVLGDNWQNDSATWSMADFTGDGLVNLADLQVLGDHWNPAAGDFAALAQLPGVPEPQALVMLGSLACGALVRRSGAVAH